MNYPNGIKHKTNKKQIDYANRGMTLESDLNISNKYYRENDIAFIYKKPTPIKVTKVDFSSKNNATIKEAFFEIPSTTDYNGIYKGKYIDFEAKETDKRASFPLSNIHLHQIKHIENIIRHGGIGFLIIRFKKLETTYLLKGEDLLSFLENESRKSIPIQYFKDNCLLIPDSYNPRLDYLKIINNIYGGKL